jgi:hypothetical protein
MTVKRKGNEPKRNYMGIDEISQSYHLILFGFVFGEIKAQSPESRCYQNFKMALRDPESQGAASHEDQHEKILQKSQTWLNFF